MKKKIIILLLGIVVITLAVLTPGLVKIIKADKEEKRILAEYEAYLASNSTFFANTFINGTDVSGKTPSEVIKSGIAEFSSQAISVTNPWTEDKDIIKYSDLNTDYSKFESYVSTLYDSQTLTKEEYCSTPVKREYSYNIKDDVDIKNADFSNVSFLKAENVCEAVDAKLVTNLETGVSEIIPEIYGNILKDGVLETKILSAVKEGSQVVSLEKNDFILPAVTSDNEELISTKERYDVILNKTINIYISGIKVVMEPSETRKYIDITSETLLNEELLDELMADLGKKYNTYGIRRPFVTSTGESILTPGGDYGWKMDPDETKLVFEQALLSDEKVDKVDTVYLKRGQRPITDEISNTYVEISLRDQKIWMYVNGVKIVDDDCTTGMVGVPESITNVGMFSLTYKTTNRILRGPTWEDFVYYWMPYDGSNGMHDATWRTDEEFGGTNRYGNGSHGCVNLRLPIAEIIYNNIQADTPIIIWE